MATILGPTPDAGGCWIRMLPGRVPSTYFHPRAPRGVSICQVCARTVVRGKGRWWEGR
jgi:hypothetical protein